MPLEIDEHEIVALIEKRIDQAHWFGEGVGGSGHMACVYPSKPTLKSIRETTIDGKPCIKILYSYDVTRESEFGGTVDSYRKELVLDRTMNVLSDKELDHRVHDLLAPYEDDVEDFTPPDK